MPLDYKRNGTTGLFAALDIKTGQVITDYRDSHTALDVLAFFKQIEQVPRDLDIHVVLDNLRGHKADEVTTWLRRPPPEALGTCTSPPPAAGQVDDFKQWFGVDVGACLLAPVGGAATYLSPFRPSTAKVQRGVYDHDENRSNCTAAENRDPDWAMIVAIDPVDGADQHA